MTPTFTRPLALLASLLAAAPVSAAGQRARLLAPATGDVAARTLSADAAPVSPGIDRTPVALSWPIDQAAADLDARPAAHRAESRVYWQRSDAAQLARGVRLALSEPGALIKLSPQSGAPLELAALELVDPRGKIHRGPDALVPLADPEHLRRAGVAFPAGTTIFTVRPELGAGSFTLRGRVAGPVLVYVLEREARAHLSLEPATDLALAGDTVHVVARLRDGTSDLTAAAISGRLLAPDGSATDFALTRAADGSYRADVVAPTRRLAPGDLHTLEVEATGVSARGLPVRRIASTALAVVAPTARYTGAVSVDHDTTANTVHIRLAVDVAAASRFGASAVLYGSNRQGERQPIGVGQAAQWLDRGAGELVLEFDAATLTAGGLHAPYELRDLRLVDQGRLAPLHRQARALALPQARH